MIRSKILLAVLCVGFLGITGCGTTLKESSSSTSNKPAQGYTQKPFSAKISIHCLLNSGTSAIYGEAGAVEPNAEVIITVCPPGQSSLSLQNYTISKQSFSKLDSEIPGENGSTVYSGFANDLGEFYIYVGIELDSRSTYFVKAQAPGKLIGPEAKIPDENFHRVHNN